MYRSLYSFLILALSFSAASAQEILPALTVKNINGKIIVSWLNEYPLVVKNINIQRSYDSLKNYTTIGSVLNPQNKENGYADENPPYNKMYYRVFISFDGGEYVFSESVRPVKEILPPTVVYNDATVKDHNAEHNPDPRITADPNRRSAGTEHNNLDSARGNSKAGTTSPAASAITYPSRRIFTSRDNNIVIYLPDAGVKSYIVTFYDEANKKIFQLNKLSDPYLILEKANFKHAGWFSFEVFESGKLVEKNRFYVPRDGKSQPIPEFEQGKRN